MDIIDPAKVQSLIDSFAKQPVYLHLETTNGAYASHKDESFFSANAYIRNARIEFQHGKITGEGPFRVGLKLDIGWVYADGLTHFEFDELGRLLLAGHGFDEKLAVALQLSKTPFD